MAVRHDKKIAMVHITKTAGVAITSNFNMIVEGNHSDYKYYHEKYPNYKLFCIVRNPYDRIVSAYEYMRQWDDEHPERKRYQHIYENGFLEMCRNLKKYKTLLLKPQHKFVCKGNKIMVDKYFKFEERFWFSLFDFFGEKAGRNQHNVTKKREHFKKYYTKESKELVKEFYKKDFEIFKYKI